VTHDKLISRHAKWGKHPIDGSLIASILSSWPPHRKSELSPWTPLRSVTMKHARRPSPKIEKSIPDFARRPYRIHLEQVVEVAGFSKLKLRPIRLDDESKMVEFHRGISPKSIVLRYFGYLGFDRRTTHERLVRVCTNTDEVYSVVIEQPAHTRSSIKILAVGRLIKTPEPYVAMFDILIGDEANIPKLAKILLNRLINLGRAFHFQILSGKLLGLDKDAINLCLRMDFTVQNLTEEGAVQVLLKL
jgi:acetyltransferase